jgi:hypothetical protein
MEKQKTLDLDSDVDIIEREYCLLYSKSAQVETMN